MLARNLARDRLQVAPLGHLRAALSGRRRFLEPAQRAVVMVALAGSRLVGVPLTPSLDVNMCVSRRALFCKDGPKKRALCCITPSMAEGTCARVSACVCACACACAAERVVRVRCWCVATHTVATAWGCDCPRRRRRRRHIAVSLYVRSHSFHWHALVQTALFGARACPLLTPTTAGAGCHSIGLR